MTTTRSKSAPGKNVSTNPSSLFSNPASEEKKSGSAVVNRTRQTMAFLKALDKDDKNKMVEALKNGADPDFANSDGSFLLKAAAEGDVELAKLLIEYKADVNIKGGYYNCTPLHAATNEGGKLEMVLLLIENDADSRIKNSEDATPLENMKANGVSEPLIEYTLRQRTLELDKADAIKRQEQAERAYRAPSPYD